MKTYIAVDTSIAACGIAMYVPSFRTVPAKLTFGTLRPNKDGPVNWRAADLWDRVKTFTGVLPIEDVEVFIEMPTFQQSGKGVIAAVDGGLIKLAFVAGYLSGMFADSYASVRLITPSLWKGMLSKDQTRERILRHPILGKHLQDFKFDHNASDAIGMIAWAMADQRKLDISKAEITTL